MSDCLINSDWKGCCCVCKHQLTVYKHPWNENEYAKGSIMEVLGYVCNIPGDDRGTFLDRKHSFCEEYMLKENKWKQKK